MGLRKDRHEGSCAAGVLTVCAAAELAFYAILGAIVAKLIAATVTAKAAFGSAVFSWAGAAIIVEEASIDSGLIITAVGLLTALLGTHATAMATVYREAVAPSGFPRGKWPHPTTGRFSDARSPMAMPTGH